MVIVRGCQSRGLRSAMVSQWAAMMSILEHMTAVVSVAIDVLTLRAAMEHRDQLGTAKGLLMERNRIDADAAFALMARVSQDTNTKVATTAERVIAARSPTPVTTAAVTF